MQNQDIINTMNRYGIRGKDTALMLAVEKAIKVASFPVPVLITGENGTGKEVFHRILHDGSRRRNGKCLAINCGGLPEETIISELFGHVKGAYTGSVGERKGYFEEADGGTLFLDEVGELPLNVQAKLLRVLENGEIIRMGSNEVRKVDVRIVAATNVDMQKAIREGRFRQDLYYRLSTVTIHVPALRERGDDVVTLFRYFAGEVARKYGMRQKIELTDQARMMLRGYQWPGNVRQLLHVVEELSIIQDDSHIITPEILHPYIPASGAIATGGDANVSLQDISLMKAAIYELKLELDEVREKLGMKAYKPTIHALPPASNHDETHGPTTIYPSSSQPMFSAEDVEAEDITVESFPSAHTLTDEPHATFDNAVAETPRTLEQIEREAIMHALQRHNGNKRKAAEELQISERTIHRKIQDFGLDVKD